MSRKGKQRAVRRAMRAAHAAPAPAPAPKQHHPRPNPRVETVTEWGELIQLDPREDLTYYSPYSINNLDIWTEKAIRQEYTRLRSIATKRLRTIAKSEFSDSKTYKYNEGQYGTIRELEKQAAAEGRQPITLIKQKLAQVARMVSARSGSLKGMRDIEKQTIKTLHERGYTEINKGNLKEFGEFMAAWKQSEVAQAEHMGSPTAERLYRASMSAGMREEVMRNFDFYSRHIDRVEQVSNADPVDAEHYRKALMTDANLYRESQRARAEHRGRKRK